MQKDLGLLFLRVGSGLMMMFPHGWGKLTGFTANMNNFPDVIGIGGPASMALAVFAEFFCAALLILGIKTRYVAIPLLITMLVAVFIVHGADPWMKKELAALYAVCYASLIASGGGKFSIKE